MDESNKLPVALCYFLLPIWLVSLIIFLLKKDEDDTVKFLTLQALVASVIVFVLNIVLSIIGFVPIVGCIAALISLPVTFGAWGYGIYLGVKIMKDDEEPEIPFVGEYIQNSLM